VLFVVQTDTESKTRLLLFKGCYFYVAEGYRSELENMISLTH